MFVFGNLRYSSRQLRKHPSFTVTVLATLALCIGANTAVFAVVERAILQARALSGCATARYPINTHRYGGASETNTSQTGAQWEAVRDHATLLNSAIYSALGGMNLFTDHRVEYVGTQRISENFFHVLGVEPALGREFTRAEDVLGGPPLAIISYRLWQRVFHGNREVIGRSFELGGTAYTIIGVAPSGFVPPSHSLVGDRVPIEVWAPLHPSVHGEGSGSNYGIVARLKPGVSFAQADAQLNAVMQDIFDHMKQAGSTMEEQAMPLQRAMSFDMRRSFRLMWCAVAVVLLIGCINVAGLLLARSGSRAREIATRQALGASRSAIVGELLAECFLLALGGGLAGLAIGQYALTALVRLNPGAFDIWGPLHLDARVITIMLLVSATTSVLFGLAPSLQTAKVDLRASLAESGRNSVGTRSPWKRQALVFTEVALGVVLLVCASLFVRTFSVLANTDPGLIRTMCPLRLRRCKMRDTRQRPQVLGCSGNRSNE